MQSNCLIGNGPIGMMETQEFPNFTSIWGEGGDRG